MGNILGNNMKIILRRGRAIFLQFVQSLCMQCCICCLTLQDRAPEALACRRRAGSEAQPLPYHPTRFARHTPPSGSRLSFHKGRFPRRGKVKTGQCCRTRLGTAEHGGLGAAELVWEADEQGQAGRQQFCRGSKPLSSGSVPIADTGFSWPVTLPLSFPHGSKVQKQQNPWCV